MSNTLLKLFTRDLLLRGGGSLRRLIFPIVLVRRDSLRLSRDQRGRDRPLPGTDGWNDADLARGETTRNNLAWCLEGSGENHGTTFAHLLAFLYFVSLAFVCFVSLDGCGANDSCSCLAGLHKKR